MYYSFMSMIIPWVKRWRTARLLVRELKQRSGSGSELGHGVGQGEI